MKVTTCLSVWSLLCVHSCPFCDPRRRRRRLSTSSLSRFTDSLTSELGKRGRRRPRRRRWCQSFRGDTYKDYWMRCGTYQPSYQSRSTNIVHVALLNIYNARQALYWICMLSLGIYDAQLIITLQLEKRRHHTRVAKVFFYPPWICLCWCFRYLRKENYDAFGSERQKGKNIGHRHNWTEC